MFNSFTRARRTSSGLWHFWTVRVMSCTRGQYTPVCPSNPERFWNCHVGLSFECVLRASQRSGGSRSGDVSRGDSSGRRTDRVGGRDGSCSRSFNWSSGCQRYNFIFLCFSHAQAPYTCHFLVNKV